MTWGAPAERSVSAGTPMRVAVAGPPQDVAGFIRSIAGFTVLQGVAGPAVGDRLAGGADCGPTSSALRGRVGLPNGLVLELVAVSDELAAAQQAGRVIGQVLVVDCEPDGRGVALARSLWAALPVPAVVAITGQLGRGLDELGEHRVRAGLGLPAFTPVACYDLSDRASVRDVLLALLVAVLDLLDVSRARREANG